MKNNDGFSWPETILSLSITLIIATTLLPLLHNFTVQLEEKKRKYHASIVMNEATKMFITENISTGSIHIEKVAYMFVIDNENICVIYEGVREEKTSCLTISNRESWMRKDIH
ncbi:type II secretion system protein [Psychrobacillus sp. FSL H8-0483]|uniref:type II secretion system protein n=1 Tax=Psychrobacillus sp. FSL H8-0483 TaxID=2921389 RepID=UPI00315A27D0